ncbi:nicotinate-nucleotide--dimethylbenzimidazole phosphoribosyltransferase [Streptomyces sioyaensis]|uniref:nicotinate-nucleotide--dimethylbenzimidazole phosphoribosyltransferase n=1 Tax=Streptomyces sioyaensis TaxID=67364 RepID=UPI001F236892|nr:nicotinate-nucleotide--dimethylbenzimidazole phosphoribosyltransferase [Streptomyces sioyaensis]MCF3177662.1 nicotinate-nucleotide--dimethylbenzimidazole phosphoribosyltransferase [Streptomyces sioyaensis]
MTDTGQVPGEGQPENAGGHPGQPQPAAAPSPADAGPAPQPGMVPPPGEYPYVDQPDGAVEDDDLLLMPGAQGAWSEQPAPQPLPQPQETHQGPDQQLPQGAPYDAAAQGATGFEPLPAQAGDHESGGRDSGSVDLGAVRIPQPAAPQQPDRARAAAPATPPRRPLHMGPPVPDATGGVVRSLADRGPAEAPAQAVAPQVEPPTGGPEYFDAPAGAPEAMAGPPAGGAHPGQQFGDAAAQGFAAPSYGGQPYEGQLSAEQTYGAAGQGPLPGPQLGEIPSQVTPWSEPSAQAAPDGVAETVAPEAPTAPEAAQPAPQDAPLPAEQPQPLPVESAAQPADVASVVADVPGAVPGERADAPAQPQDVMVEALPEAAAPVPDGTAGVEGAVVDATAPDAAVAEAPGVDAVAPSAPAQEAPAQDAAAVVQQPEVVATDVPQEVMDQEGSAEAGAEPEAQAQAAGTPAPAAADEAVQPAEPEADQPAAETPAAPVDATPAPQPVQPAGDGPTGAVPEATDVPEAAQVPVTTDQPQQPADQPQPVEPAPAVEAAQPEPGTEAAPAPAAPAEAAAGDLPVAGPVATPEPAAVQEDSVALPVSEEAASPEQAVIEPPETQQPAAGQPQPGAPADAAGQQTAEAPAPAAAPQGPDAGAERQPVADGSENPAEPAAPVAPIAEAPLPEPPPVVVHIPAQASGEQPTTAVPAPAPDAPAAARDDMPQQQDATALVQLGEDDDQSDDQPQPTEAQQSAAAPDGDAADTPAGAPADASSADVSPAAGYDDSERAAVHRVMRERRDIRNGFRSDPIPNDVLLRVLEAAHTAPSVGHSQPWDFVVIRSAETREKMHQLAMQQREAYAKSLPKARAKQFRELKIEAILETPVNIVVTADSTRGGRHTLGRHTQPQMAPYSSALAVENLWLAARAEGLGVGWVSFFDEREMVRELDLPEHLEVVAYLCVGYVDEFPEEPELLQAGWSKRRPLSWVVHEETYGRRALPGESPHDLLQETLQGIRPLDAKALGEAWERQKRMTKPAGALGMLEIISAQLCGLSRKCPPPIPEPAAVAIFAGDHGVHAQGVTPWPQEVTGQMVANFLGGGAVCNAFAHQVGAEVCVVDVGVASDLPATPGLLPRKVRPGTADFTAGPAMTQEDVLKAIEVGIDTARDLVAAGNKALLTGEMGIANTTTSAALIAVYTGVDAAEVTGRGTGINDETHARKVEVVRRALELHQPDPADPIGVLAALGGLEHAAMVGLILGGASLRTPVILDGVSAGAAALVARAIAPEALAACIAGHRSAEPGHVAALNKLGLRPLVDLDLRLGEGTGALLALPVVQSAARAMHEVATFDSAGVTEKI